MAENKNSKVEDLHLETASLHAGLERSENEVKDVPIYASTSFIFNNSAHGAAIFSMDDEAYCYSRIRNPTDDAFEKRMAALEGGAAALATASGEAAVFTTITALAQRGDNIVVASAVSETTALQFKHRLPTLGIIARFIEDGDVTKVQAAIDEKTKAVFVESIPIGATAVSDIDTLSSLAHSHGVPLVVDNTYGASGYLLRPISHGADLVLASCAPYISISGANQGGVIIDSGHFPWEGSQSRFPQLFEPSPGFHGMRIWEKFGKLAFVAYARIAVMRDIGPCLNPFEASLLLAGVETLAVRMEKISQNALELTKALQSLVGEVVCLGLPTHSENSLNRKYLKRGHGGVFPFLLKETEFSKLSSRLKIVSTGHSIGGSRTILIPGPSESENKEKGQASSRIYVSVGLENIEDLKADFAQAFEGLEKAS